MLYTCIYIYICIYIWYAYTYISIYIYIHIYTYVHIYIYICIHTHVNKYTYIYVCVRVCVCVCVCARACLCVCVCVYVYIYSSVFFSQCCCTRQDMIISHQLSFTGLFPQLYVSFHTCVVPEVWNVSVMRPLACLMRTCRLTFFISTYTQSSWGLDTHFVGLRRLS